MNVPDSINSEQCPLCGGPNECQLCSPAGYKGTCWCAQMEMPAELLAQIPEEFRRCACICKECVTRFLRRKDSGTTPKILPGDYYFDTGLMVFTAAFHLRRGYCCGNGCRHCPYPKLSLQRP